jgi:hypothetical protein
MNKTSNEIVKRKSERNKALMDIKNTNTEEIEHMGKWNR